MFYSDLSWAGDWSLCSVRYEEINYTPSQLICVEPSLEPSMVHRDNSCSPVVYLLLTAEFLSSNHQNWKFPYLLQLFGNLFYQKEMKARSEALKTLEIKIKYSLCILDLGKPTLHTIHHPLLSQTTPDFNTKYRLLLVRERVMVQSLHCLLMIFF